MYYQNYEDYMRQVLGYPINDPNIYETYHYRDAQNYEDTYSLRNQPTTNQIRCNLSEDEINECYPEIYRLVYPMICRVCDANTQPVTKELIEKMTDEVYFAIGNTQNTVNIRVETPKPEETRAASSKTQRSDTASKRTPVREENKNERKDISKAEVSKAENRSSTLAEENRQSNSSLRDLIKILILYRLFGKRPGGNPRPPRPPFPGGPGNRPPIMPRDYNNYLEF